MDTERVLEIIDKLTAIKDHPRTSAEESVACAMRIKELREKYNIPKTPRPTDQPFDPYLRPTGQPFEHPYMPPNFANMNMSEFLDFLYSPFAYESMRGFSGIFVVREDNTGREPPFDVPRVTVWPTPPSDSMDFDDSMDEEYKYAPEEEDDDNT